MVLLAFAGLNFAAVYLGFQFYFEPDNQAVLWPGSGLFMGALMITRTRAWPALILVATLSHMSVSLLVYDGALLRATLYAINNIPEAIVGAFLVRRVCGGVPDISKLSNVLSLVVIGAVLSTLFTAVGVMVNTIRLELEKAMQEDSVDD